MIIAKTYVVMINLLRNWEFLSGKNYWIGDFWKKKLKIQSFQDKKRKTGENYKNSHSLGRRKQSLSLERKENSAVVSGILLIRKNSPCHLRNIKEMMYLGKFKNSCFPEGYEKPAVFWEKKESAPVWGGKNESLWLGKN